VKELRNGYKKEWLPTFRQGTVRVVHWHCTDRSTISGTRYPALVQGASVTFEPGARTAWHTHPLGQTLIVTAGCGWTQRWGEPVEEMEKVSDQQYQGVA